MLMGFDYKLWIPEFSLKNPNLSSLASEAAVDIDNYVGGRSQEDKSVRYLSQLLNDITQGENPKAKLPDNCNVLGYAISGREKFDGHWRGKCIDDVVLQINLVAKELRDFKSLSQERQKALVEFCVSLSKETAYHYMEYYSGQSRLVA